MEKFGVHMDRPQAIHLIKTLAAMGNQRKAAKALSLAQSTFSGRFNKAFELLGAQEVAALMKGSNAALNVPAFTEKGFKASKANKTNKASKASKANKTPKPTRKPVVTVAKKAPALAPVVAQAIVEPSPVPSTHATAASSTSAGPSTTKQLSPEQKLALTLSEISHAPEPLEFQPIVPTLVRYLAKVRHVESVKELAENINSLDELFLAQTCAVIKGEPVDVHWDDEYIGELIQACNDALQWAEDSVTA